MKPNQGFERNLIPSGEIAIQKLRVGQSRESAFLKQSIDLMMKHARAYPRLSKSSSGLIPDYDGTATIGRANP
jgi:hypothetical protein